MRALIAVSASFGTVAARSKTSCTKTLTRSLPRSRAASLCVKRPSSTMRSSKLACSTACTAAVADFAASAIAASIAALIQAQLCAQFLPLLGVAHHILQDLVELLVALQAPAKIRELAAQIQQFLQRTDLIGNLFRLKVRQLVEGEVDLEFRIGIVTQLVVDGKREVRTHFVEHLVEVVRIHLDELPLHQFWQRLFRVSGKVAENAHNKWELLQFDRVADFYVVSDMHARCTNARQFLLSAFSAHMRTPCRDSQTGPGFNF